jgi:two-component system response regulator HydG
MSARILIVDDDDGVRFLLREILCEEGLDVEDAASGAEALAALERSPFDLVLTDLRMPGLDGMDVLRAAVARPRPPRVILLTAHGSERHAVAAIKEGAFDYLAKPFDPDELVACVHRALETVRLQAENERLSSELNLSRSLVFASPAMSRLAVLVQRVAPRDVTVLITGESGTGKERVAEALVRASDRASRPFVRFNCASVSGDLAEAELFGHTRGAFTGAHRERSGLFREAHTGTLLLDEVAELDASVQAKLLRVLQESEVRAVGEDRPRSIDVRVLAATHRDLKVEVAAGRFREDLYWRLDVVHLSIPPLRERPEDIPVLARHFLRRYCDRFGVARATEPPELLARLLGWQWPGNVRELENAIEALVALSAGGVFDLELLPGGATAVDRGPLGLKERMATVERGLVADALRRAKGNRSEAARQLQISRVTLHDKLNKYGLGGEPS